MITKIEFNHLIKSPKKYLENLDLEQIIDLKNQFRYCEIIYNIFLLKSHLINDVNFTKNLTIVGLYSSNRKHLFELINTRIKLQTNESRNNTSNLFEDWLKDPSLIKKHNRQTDIYKRGIQESTSDNDYLTTETLAKIYVEQGHYQRAIQAYQILCLKYPKKSAFFANQIKKIKTKLN